MTKRNGGFRRGLSLKAVRSDVRGEVDEEIRFYLERRAEEFVEQGVPEEEAWRRAVEAFGDLGEVEAECRDISERDAMTRRMGEMLHTLWQDVRFGVRGFLRRPAFTVVAFLTIALGVGATTTIFSLVDGVLLRPLPYEDSSELVDLGMDWSADGTDRTRDALRLASASIPNFVDWRDMSSSFESMGGVVLATLDLMGTESPERVRVGLVSEEFFPVLRQTPMLGRLFLETEHEFGAEEVAVLGHGLWQRRYGGDPGIVGQTIDAVDGRYVVVGVFPPEVQLPESLQAGRVDVWMPLRLADPQFADRSMRPLDIISRLAPGVGIRAAREEMDALSLQLAEAYPDVLVDARTGDVDVIGVSPMLRQAVGDVRRTLLTLLGAVGFLLLIACTNVANLFLARGTERAGEIALRSALGAGRARLTRQLLTESVVLAVGAGLAGVALAYVGIELFKAGPANVPRLSEVQLDLRLLGFALGLSVFVGCVFGLAPVLQAARKGAAEGLKEGSRGSTGRGARRLRSSLVALETGLALVLLTGAGLLANSFVRLASVDPGFEPENLAELRVRLRTDFDAAEQNLQFFEELSAEIGAIPGVESVASSINLPVGRTNWRTGAITEVGNYSEEGLTADGIPVSPGYFSTTGIDIVAGREFNRSDNSGDAVVVVNESFAERAFAGAAATSAVGKRIQFGNFRGESHWHTIVGIVADVKQAQLRADGEPAMFVPWGHFTWPSQSFVVRSSVPPADLFPALRRAVWSLDPTLPIATVRTMEDRIAATIVTPRFMALLLAMFAGTALLLAAVGIFGTTAYSVGRRRREVGIRIAMGAAADDVARLMAREGFRVVAGGLVLGIMGSLALSRVLASLLYEVKPTDPATLLAVVSVLAMVGLLACYVPARRATRVDASETLRSE